MSGHLPDHWIFAYGSLMWRPGFAHTESRTARLHGFHRSLCIYSHIYRGTQERPGLVMGLARGGSCLGVAFRIAPENWARTYEYLTARELITAVYHEKRLTVRLADGRTAQALTYVADPRHAQYAGRLDRARLLDLVRQGQGAAGTNADYVRQTFLHLKAMGFEDDLLGWLDGKLDIDASAPQPAAAP